MNSYEPIVCLLDGKPFVVNPQEGSFLFVADWVRFAIPEDVVVIGVENMENFRMIRQQRIFFEQYLQAHDLSTRVLFVSRYPQSTDLRRWLCTIPNHYLHFGDFDLAGINIFLVDFQRYLGEERSSYLIPDDVESRRNRAPGRDTMNSITDLRVIKSEVPELQHLID